MSSTPGPAMELLGRVAYELHHMRPLIPTYIHLLVSAIFPIYTAAHASLARPSSAAPAKKKEVSDVSDLQDEEISPAIETLSPSDALLFPLLAGLTLASLYFIIKWLQDPALLNYYLGLYFALVGLFFAIKFIKDALSIVRSMTLPNQYTYGGKLWKLAPCKRCFVAAGAADRTSQRTSPLPGVFGILFRRYNSAVWSLRTFVYTRLNLRLRVWKLVDIITCIDTLDLISITIAAPLVYYHTFIDKPWFLTNILGFSFCYGSLQMTTPGTSSTGTLLLCALFFYDIYFVFFTPMMVTVATKLDVPIKLLFPRPDGCEFPIGAVEGSQEMEEYLKCIAKKRTMAMLGLGDIVIPGMMLAFALRFDLYIYYQKLAAAAKSLSASEQDTLEKVPYSPATGLWGERFWTSSKLHSPELQAKRFPKRYFHASVIGYVVGMITTVVVMQVSQHAQPALLYLVPGVLFAFWGVAFVQGDIKALYNYSEVPEELKSKNSTEKTDDAAKAGDPKQIDGEKDTGNDGDKNDSKSSDSTEQALTTFSTKKDKTESQAKATDAPKNKTKKDESNDHLILFSLSVVNLRKSEQSPTAETDSSKVSGTSAKLANQSESSPDSYDETSKEVVSEQDNTQTQPTQTTAVTTSDDPDLRVHARSEGNTAAEPALKRRRKV